MPVLARSIESLQCYGVCDGIDGRREMRLGDTVSDADGIGSEAAAWFLLETGGGKWLRRSGA